MHPKEKVLPGMQMKLQTPSNKLQKSTKRETSAWCLALRYSRYCVLMTR